jgi:hypothetical protein
VDESLIHWNAAKKKGKLINDDYHGNFDAPQFEMWFQKLCQSLWQTYGACHIYMDGASYHKRNITPVPNTSSRKPDIQAWLLEHGKSVHFVYPTHDNDSLFIYVTLGVLYPPSAVKAQLLQLVKGLNIQPLYMARVIANAHNHQLMYTPPYHPDLQPIELIWADIKGRIAREPAKNITELNSKLVGSFSEVLGKTWCGAYRHVQKVENEYFSRLDESPHESVARVVDGSSSEEESCVV